jgi:hypothetical protein
MMKSRPAPMTSDDAEALAIQALSFLAADIGRLERFLSLTGSGPDDLRRAGDDPAILAGVLEYVLGDEPQLLEFAANASLPPDQVQRAWDLLTLDAMRAKRP